MLVFISQFCFYLSFHYSFRLFPCGDKKSHQFIRGKIHIMGRDCFFPFNYSRIPMLAFDLPGLIGFIHTPKSINRA